MGLAVQTLFDQPGDEGPVGLGDGQASQRDDDVLTRLALAVAIGLEQLEALAGG